MIKKALLTMGALVLCSTVGTSVVSAEQHLTDEQIEWTVAGLSDDKYILPLKEGGFIVNGDGSSNFLEEQIRMDGNPITVAQYKEYLRNVDLDTLEPSSSDIPPTMGFRGAHIPSNVKTLAANQSHYSEGFYAPGWRYSNVRFVPARGTGDYLFWQAIGDSGIVEDGGQVSVTLGANAAPVSVYSRNGTYFKTYNPAPNSRYFVNNPV